MILVQRYTCQTAIQKISFCFWQTDSNARTLPKMVGSKPESSSASNNKSAAWPFSKKETRQNTRTGDFCKKVAARDIQLAATCNDVAKKMPNFDFAVRIKNNAEPKYMGPALHCLWWPKLLVPSNHEYLGTSQKKLLQTV